MKPRRILYVTRIHAGGVAVVVDNLVRGLDRKRYESIVLFYTHEQSHIREKLSEIDIQVIGLEPHPKKYGIASSKPKKRKNIGEWVEAKFGEKACQYYLFIKDFFKFLIQDVPKIKYFMKTIRENRIDIVHAHSDINKGKAECIASWILRKPCISHIHAYQKLTYFDKIFLRFVKFFIYISTDIAEHYITQGIPRLKGTIIHNGVDINDFLRTYDTDSVRSEFNIKSEDILVGLIGRIDWWKGHEYFIEAIAEVSKTVPAIKGLVIGWFSKSSPDRNRQYFDKLRFIVKSLNLQEKIIFTGYRSDISRIIAAMDIVVHASSMPEPFGLVIIEGMAAGKPVIATAAGGVLDIIEDGVNGLLVPPQNSKAMAETILQIIYNQDKAQKIGLAARRSVAEKFTVRHHVNAVQKLYDSILITS